MTLESALDHARRGWHIHPVDHPDLPTCAGIRTREHDPATCTERGKHPATKWGSWATTDDAKIVAEWAGALRNVAVATGPSNLLVIDEDQPGGLTLYADTHGVTVPATYTVRTGRPGGGRHYYFRMPAERHGNDRGSLKAFGCDVRGDGGYVVAAGSKHQSGQLYEVEVDVDPAPVPQWLIDALDADSFSSAGSPFGLPERIAAGNRDDTLFKYACSLRAKGTRVSDAERAMRDAWGRCEQPPGNPYPLATALGKIDQAWGSYAYTGPGAPPDTPPPDGNGTKARARSVLTDRAYTRDQLAKLPTPEPLIGNTLDKRTVVLLAGPRGSLKSFIIVSWAASIATGQPWLGRPIHTTGRSLIVAAEGAHGLHQRIAAWEDEYCHVEDGALTVIAGPVNLLDRSQVDELAAFVAAGRYSFVALDTLARCMVGGDENSARDAGIVVDSLYRLREATGDNGVVVGVHHAPRGDSGRPRGSSALDAGVDGMYCTEGDPVRVTMTRTKRKDGPTDDVLNVRLELRGMSGLVADTAAGLSNRADELLSVFMSAFSRTGATKADLRAVADMPPATFHRSLNSLLSLGILHNYGSEARPMYRCEPAKRVDLVRRVRSCP